jgi:hypothetical protein
MGFWELELGRHAAAWQHLIWAGSKNFSASEAGISINFEGLRPRISGDKRKELRLHVLA